MNEGIATSKTAFILFVGEPRTTSTSLSPPPFDSLSLSLSRFAASGFGFSAFPVLATLLNSMNLLNKPIGVQTISLAAVEDIVVWVILAVASAFSSGGSALQGLYTLLLTLAFIAIMVVLIRPIFNRVHRFYLNKHDDCNLYIIVGCFLLLLIASFTTEVMGIHAFFGAFIAGLCIPRQGELVEFLSIRIELIIVEFFLPFVSLPSPSPSPPSLSSRRLQVVLRQQRPAHPSEPVEHVSSVVDVGRVDSAGVRGEDRAGEHRHEGVHGQVVVLLHLHGRADEHARHRPARRLEHRRAARGDQSRHLRHVRPHGHRAHLPHLAHPLRPLLPGQRE